jgi:hypothetical protein
MNGAFEIAVETVRRASDRGLPLRLIGGQAVRYLTPGFLPRIQDGQDIDFASVSSAAREVTTFLADSGFVADERFNALHGRRQMYFEAPDSLTSVDIIVNQLSMCHVLDFKDRIDRMPHTLDVDDLLLSKLQVVEQTAKDIHDIAYLLSAFPISEDDRPGVIGLGRFGGVVAQDWGWWRTVTNNLEKAIAHFEGTFNHVLPPDAPYSAIEQARSLMEHAEEVPKALRWKVRSRVGERVRWYELPETVDR